MDYLEILVQSGDFFISHTLSDLRYIFKLHIVGTACTVIIYVFDKIHFQNCAGSYSNHEEFMLGRTTPIFTDVMAAYPLGPKAVSG